MVGEDRGWKRGVLFEIFKKYFPSSPLGFLEYSRNVHLWDSYVPETDDLEILN